MVLDMGLILSLPRLVVKARYVYKMHDTFFAWKYLEKRYTQVEMACVVFCGLCNIRF